VWVSGGVGGKHWKKQQRRRGHGQFDKWENAYNPGESNGAQVSRLRSFLYTTAFEKRLVEGRGERVSAPLSKGSRSGLRKVAANLRGESVKEKEKAEGTPTGIVKRNLGLITFGSTK